MLEIEIDPLGKSQVDLIKDKSYESISEALSVQTTRIRAAGFTLTSMLWDGESALSYKERAEAKLGLSITSLPSGQHVPDIAIRNMITLTLVLLL